MHLHALGLHRNNYFHLLLVQSQDKKKHTLSQKAVIIHSFQLYVSMSVLSNEGLLHAEVSIQSPLTLPVMAFGISEYLWRNDPHQGYPFGP